MVAISKRERPARRKIVPFISALLIAIAVTQSFFGTETLLETLSFNSLPQTSDTGSFANCTTLDPAIALTNRTATVSCRTLQFSVSTEAFQSSGGKVIIGVVSGAKNLEWRQSIRKTWASKGNTSGNKSVAVFFVVAGPWKDIEDEYHKYNDMIWIDMEESFRLISYKTSMFLQVVAIMTSELGVNYTHVLKTDDDSYVAVNRLESFVQEQPEMLYWGNCKTYNSEPIRNPDSRYFISREEYPESQYPPYCTGAGILLARKTVECMANTMKNVQFLAMEDVFVGLLAERCDVRPVDSSWVRKYRVEGHVNMNRKETAGSWLTNATMTKRYVQHQINNHDDMMAHHAWIQEQEHWGVNSI
jgi:beta-1,3-galactosyltransferase 1